jgi:hypothetical protein
MDQKKMRFLGLGTVFLAVGLVFGILKTNDHVECTTSVSSTTDQSGCVVVTELHQCQERFAI